MYAAVIPARLQSTRLREKLLLEIDGKSILQRVYENVISSKLLNEVFIATDSQRILEHAQSFGAQAFITSDKHESGSDRIAELAQKNPQWQVVVNVQGDEPFIQSQDIDKVLNLFKLDPTIEMASIFHTINDPIEAQNPNIVKVVVDDNNNALYFSRGVIPYDREPNTSPVFNKHIGLYAYSRDCLLRINRLAKSELETREKLEQLRALQNGVKIKMLQTDAFSIGIDTEADYKSALEYFKQNS